MKRFFSILCSIVICYLINIRAVNAEMVTLIFEGLVEGIYASGPVTEISEEFTATFSEGQKFSASISIETTAPDEYPTDPNFSVYNAILGFEITIRELTFTFRSDSAGTISTVDKQVEPGDELYDKYDEVSVWLTNLQGVSFGDCIPKWFGINFFDFNADRINNESMQLDPNVLMNFFYRDWQLTFHNFGVQNVYVYGNISKVVIIQSFFADYGRTDCGTGCAGDLDDDGDVDGGDLSLFIGM